ncbi:MAG TPA: PEP/pyruvate-binding domain-containing protein [Bacteroidales bacterium]|nr:PEP/pyruvate-binding domain-containing protein [Bacteroidales bacterium]
MNELNENKVLEKLIFENRERLKELACINQTTQILKEGKSIEETLLKICTILPKAWLYPGDACARIIFDNNEFKTPNFKETPWYLSQNFETIDERKGKIQVYYLKELPTIDEGPFLKEEKYLLDNITNLITGYINSISAKAYLKKTKLPPSSDDTFNKKIEINENFSGRKLLQKFLNKQNYNRDIFHDLMPFRVREILLIANLYDAYNIEKDGHFTEHMLETYYQFNLTSMPRVTGVSSSTEALQELHSKHFDLVILMIGVDKYIPLEIGKQIKQEFPYIPVFALLNNNNDIAPFTELAKENFKIDRIFTWNGNSKIFFAMIKYLEDKVNVENDTKIGLVRVILLVEDSPVYYSKYLPLLYSNVLEQTKRIIEDVNADEFLRVLRLRARPKILLASSFEEALQIFHNYKDHLLCLITDVKFTKNGKVDEYAGFKLVEYVRDKIKDLPVIIQSSDNHYANQAYELKATFINKNSQTLLEDIQSFITHYLGFGNFVYKNAEGHQIAVARSLKEFEKLLKTVPDESLLYHARRNHFSLWLMARGEIQIAKIISPYKITDFTNASELREFLIHAIQKHRNEQNKGKVINFEDTEIIEESFVTSLCPGSLGGKGRGLAFINTLVYNFDFHQLIPNINIKTPRTLIIGTDEFDYFIERNQLKQFSTNETNYEIIRKKFIEGKLSESLVKKLKKLLKTFDKPLAIRSSGMFEDSLMQPFAGIFETYLIPNNYPDLDVRLKQICDAIKLVYASVYSPVARGYIEAINYKLQDEKMAVVIQEVVGNAYDGYFYPHISGVAQSYNYYPFAHMKPEEGFAVIAIGLGTYVVEGEKAYRFSPHYPNTDINSPKDQFRNSQTYFYAIDLNNTNPNLIDGEDASLIKLDIEIAEQHGNLRHCASVYDADNDRITPGLSVPGPRIINFADILKYNYIPLSETIVTVLDIVQEALGSTVEIEFAVDLTKDEKGIASFYLLQIKPLLGNADDYNINLENINKESLLLLANKSMGNGIISDINDVIFVDINNFDKSKTDEMAKEIEQLNAEMRQQNKKYVLIGPGRWGTRDKWIGIPVNWPQISNAKIIVETSLDGYPLDASSGSHFFHNVTAMNLGYFSIQPEISDSFINWDILYKQKNIKKYKWFIHSHFNKPLTIKMDGKKRISVIIINN